MTPLASLFDRIRERGVSVSLRPDGKLWLKPKAALTPEVLAAATAHKDELVAALLAESRPADPAPLSPVEPEAAPPGDAHDPGGDADLAWLSSEAHTVFDCSPHGTVEVRTRKPDKSWSAPRSLSQLNVIPFPGQQPGAAPTIAKAGDRPYEMLGPAPGERCAICGSGRDVKRIRHGGEVSLWHPTCTDRYLRALVDPPVKVVQQYPGAAGSWQSIDEADALRLAAIAAQREEIARRRLFSMPPDDTCPPPEVPATETEAVIGRRPHSPDPAAIAARAADLLANAQANPAVRILDPDKASQPVLPRAGPSRSRCGSATGGPAAAAALVERFP